MSKITKLETRFALRCHWTHGNLPVRRTW